MTWLRNLLRRVCRTAALMPHEGADYDYADELHEWTGELAVVDAEPDPDGWSASIGWDYREIHEWIVAGYDPTPAEPVIYNDLAARYLTPQRELEGATR